MGGSLAYGDRIMSMMVASWRRITVDGVQYRWKVQIKQTKPHADTFEFVIAVRATEHPNAKCSFVSDEIGYFWLGTNSHTLRVKPSLVAGCIRYAVQHGWRPHESKQDYSTMLTAELLAALSGGTQA